MIKISRLAASVLYETLKASNLLPDASLRLIEENGGLALDVDIPTNSDRVIRYEGEVVLVVDKTLELKIGDARIDLEDTRDGNNLVMRKAGQETS